MKEVYILSAKQISAQLPLSDAWMDEPLSNNAPLVQAVEPDYKHYFSPNQVRRLSKILKRALLTSQQAIQVGENVQPEAIVVGTGLGCIESTELFLDDLVRNGEELLKPTHFMQSTHNTISSIVAIDNHCHGYNSTYVHKGVSFECALSDVFMQLRDGRIATALVGAHDEMTPNYFTLLKRIGYLGHSTNGFAGEAAVSFLLGAAPTPHALCKVEGVEMLYSPIGEAKDYVRLQRFFAELPFRTEDVDAVMIGLNGEKNNDRVYEAVCPLLFPEKKILHYKHLFGESYSASGLGMYASSVCLAQQRIPAHLFVAPETQAQQGVKRILLYNQFEGKNHTFTLLSSCGK